MRSSEPWLLPSPKPVCCGRSYIKVAASVGRWICDMTTTSLELRHRGVLVESSRTTGRGVVHDAWVSIRGQGRLDQSERRKHGVGGSAEGIPRLARRSSRRTMGQGHVRSTVVPLEVSSESRGEESSGNDQTTQTSSAPEEAIVDRKGTEADQDW